MQKRTFSMKMEWHTVSMWQLGGLLYTVGCVIWSVVIHFLL